MLPDLNENTFGLKDCRGEGGLVIAFICNHCPYGKALVSHFVSDARILMAEGIGAVDIMSNNFSLYPNDSPENMVKFAQAHNFSFPYLLDESEEIAKLYAPVCTPGFFGFDAHLKLQYRGRLDNLRMGRQGEREAELVSAMRETEANREVSSSQLQSVRCSIKWK